MENLDNKPILEDLWMNNNLIKNFSDLDELKKVSTITCIYLAKNPVAEFPSYRETILKHCPKVSQIDASFLWKRKWVLIYYN